jgi:hypothetical protein
MNTEGTSYPNGQRFSSVIQSFNQQSIGNQQSVGNSLLKLLRRFLQTADRGL